MNAQEGIPSLPDILARGGDQIALTDADGRTARYSDLAQQLAQLSDQLAACGIRPGMRIATLLPDRAVSAAALLFLSSRVSVMPVNPALTLAEKIALIEEADVDGVLTLPEDRDEAREIAKETASQTLCLTPKPAESATGFTLSGRIEAADLVVHDAGLVLLTSGSTGLPKRVPVRMEAMMLSASNIARTLQLSDTDCALHALPMFHIGAVVDLFLAPLLAGGRIAIAPGREAAQMANTVHSRDVTWVQLVPTMLTHILETLSEKDIAALGENLRFVRAVSSDMAPALQEKAEAMLGCPIIQMYGMTETAGQITSNPLPPEPRKPGSVGPPAGAEVAILDRSGAPLPIGREGEICVRGATVMQGYENTDQAEHFYGSWLRTGDLGRLDEDGYLFLTGRMKEIINRGGEKISPQDIERAALHIPGVAEAVSYAVPHASLGEQVGLTVTGNVTPDTVKAVLAETLPEFKRPHAVRVINALPRLGSGKVDRRRVQAAHTPAKPSHIVEIQSPVAASVSAIWQEVLHGHSPAEDDDFFDAGGDSLMAVTFLSKLEKRLGHPVNANLLFQKPTFAGLCAALEDAEPDHLAHSDPLVQFAEKSIASWPGQPAFPGAVTKLFGPIEPGYPIFNCGQNVHHPHSYKRSIAKDRTLYIMRSLWSMKGRDLDKSRALAAHYASEIERIQPEGPITLHCYCEGGKIIEEIAQILHAKGREIACTIYVEYWPKREQHWPVLHVWSNASRYSAGWQWLNPANALPWLSPHGADFLQFRVDHHGIQKLKFQKKAAEFVLPYLNGERPIPRLPTTRTGPLPGPDREALYPCRLSISAPRLTRRAGEFDIILTIENRSAHDWGPTEESGFHVLLEAIHTKSKQRIGMVPLERPVNAGETLTVTHRIAARQTPFALRAMMRDDGVCEFREHGFGTAHRLIFPLLR